MTIHQFDSGVVPANTKWAFTTRRVNRTDATALQRDVRHAVAGDLLLCEITEVNQHKSIQLANQRVAGSYKGDMIVACVGDRYAPDQFEGESTVGIESADLLAAGGVVGRMVQAHDNMKLPTTVRPHGLLLDSAGEVMNIARYSLPMKPIPGHITVLGVVGASMNSGKTTAAVGLAHGLARAGYNVAGAKVTGTGAFGDFNAMEDAGVPVLDFTDAGMPTTYQMPLERIEDGFNTLVGTLAARGADIVVVEIADGVFQKETAQLLRQSRVKDRCDGVMFAAPDALSSVGGTRHLEELGIRPFAVSGMVTRSPLATREAVSAAGVPHLSRQELCDPQTVVKAAGRCFRAYLTQGADAA